MVSELKIGEVVGYVERKPKLACMVSGFWFGVCTEYRQEGLVTSELAEVGLVPFWPRLPRQERHGRGQERTVLRSMFPGYMLVKCEATDDHWAWIRSTRGVKRLLGVGTPKCITDDEIEIIRLYETEESEKETDRIAREQARKVAQEKGRSGLVWDFAPDERVRIKYGPFAGFYAQLATAADEHDRITAFVSLFGRESITEFSAFDLEKAAADE